MTMIMDPVIILVVLVAGLFSIGILVNRKLTEISEKQKPSDELLEIIKMLQAGSKEDRKVLLNSLQKNTQARTVKKNVIIMLIASFKEGK